MYRSIFKNLATDLGGEFYFQEDTAMASGGSFSPFLDYILKIPLANFEIVVHNETGTNFVGRIYAKLPKQTQENTFKIETKSHWQTLFSRNKNRFKITSENQNLIFFLSQSPHLKNLATIADTDKFQPTISGENTKGHYLLEMRYHLEFSDWTDPIKPTVSLYKSLLDEFNKRRANLTLNQYKDLPN